MYIWTIEGRWRHGNKPWISLDGGYRINRAGSFANFFFLTRENARQEVKRLKRISDMQFRVVKYIREEK